MMLIIIRTGLSQVTNATIATMNTFKLKGKSIITDGIFDICHQLLLWHKNIW